MAAKIRPAQLEDAKKITALVNRFAEQNITLPIKEENVHLCLHNWLVATEQGPVGEEQVVGCGSLVALTDKLVEIRSLALDESQHGKGIGSEIVLRLVILAKEQGFPQVCALTLRENFFIRLGFELVDRWQISPKVWQACIYCPKFHRCDEVAVLMNLAERPDEPPATNLERSPGWNRLLKWEEWQPLKLAYRAEKSTEKSIEKSTEKSAEKNGASPKHPS